jgi:transcriptional regulator with XRE-family HTH domain
MLRYHYTEGNEFGKRLHRVRKAAGMTLEDLAEALNQEFGTHANKGTISKYENGIHEPNASTIYCLAKILGVSVDFLMGRSDIDYPDLLSAIGGRKGLGDKRTLAGKAAAAAAAAKQREEAAGKEPPAEQQEETAVQLEESAKPVNYSYDMPDNSMSPQYKIGDVLIIRTGVPVISGRTYLVQYRKNQPLVRKLAIERQKWVLKPENRVFDTLELKYDPDSAAMPKDIQVIGKVIEFRRQVDDAD